MRISSIVVVVAIAAASAHAAEDNSAKARRLYQAGSKAYQGERYAEALHAFKRANELDPHVTFWFNIGQCERNLGHAQEAVVAYQKYLDGSPDAPNRAEVETFIADLKASLPGRPCHSLHVVFSSRAARTAAHSSFATTPRKLARRTTRTS